MISPYFTWWRFARTLLQVAAIAGVFAAWWHTRDGAWTTSSLAFIAVMVWIMAAQAIRWRQLKAEEASGALTIDQYKANPLAHLQGSKLFKRFMIGGAVAIAVLLSLVGAW
jgi:hypothetical protein